MNKTYFNGHTHSHYSNIRLLDATIKEDKLIDTAIELGLSGVALTDHESLSGHIKAIKHLEKLRKNASEEDREKLNNFKLVLGNEIYLVRNGLNGQNYVSGKDSYYHFILMAKDAKGHEQLRRLSSMAWENSYTKFIERVPTYYSSIEEVIGNEKGHLIATTACLGSFFAKKIVEAMDDEVALEEVNTFISWSKEWFGEDFYIEIQPSKQKDQIKYNQLAVRYAQNNNIKVTVATDAHYLRPEDRPVHKAFLNANDGEREVDAFYSSTYLMTWEEIEEYIPYLRDGVLEEIRQNTLEIMNKCEEYDLRHSQVIPKIPISEEEYSYVLPPLEKYVYINKFFNSEYIQDRYFIKKVLVAFHEKAYNKPPEWMDSRWARIEEECEKIWLVSERLGDRLSAYFTTMSKIIDIAWEDAESIVGPGRGSSYVMIVCYLLGIIQADPLESPIPLPSWRFLHEEKIELPDIDTDFQSTKKDLIIDKIAEYFGKLGGSVYRIATFGTETSKAAIQTATRGLGYDQEIGTYLSSLIPIDRGAVRSLNETFGGNEEKGWKPVSAFVTEMSTTYSDIWEVAKNIEGLISRRGTHAAGVIITNDEFTKHNAVMKAPNGFMCSQFELHDSEELGGIKYDLLVTSALDRIAVTMRLLMKYGYMENQGNLRKTYNYYLSPDKLVYDDEKMWEDAAAGKVMNLFQFDTSVGSQAIKSIKPQSLLELGQANSLMRLMPEGRDETPVEEFIDFKNNIQLFYDEINSLSGEEKHKKALLKHLEPLKGVADSQESLMLLVMDPDLTNFSVPEANFLRKTIAKKLARDVDKLRDFLYTRGRENGVSEDILDYIWNTQAARQMGYSFSLPHVMAYSTIAIQQLNLTHRFPVVFWNTASLIVDSGGMEDDDEDGLFATEEEMVPKLSFDDDDTSEEEEEEEDDADEVEENSPKKRKKTKVVNYGKLAAAIGKMERAGISISPPDINTSDFTFTPDVEKNKVVFGIKGIMKINANIAKQIIENRPYSSLADFMEKVKLSKLPMINLIKAGAFDEIEGKDRIAIMSGYLRMVADQKKRLTLSNGQMLINNGLMPDTLSKEIELYLLNKKLKKQKKGAYYFLTEEDYILYEKHYPIDILILEDRKLVPAAAWDKIYKEKISPMRDYIKGNTELLNRLNNILLKEVFDKYASGSVSKWEMESVNFYYHEHELAGVDHYQYDARDFYDQPEDPVVDRTFKSKDGKIIPLFELWRVIGTVLGKDKSKHTVTILTTTGVVDVKIYGPQFAKYDKQVSKKLPNGRRKIMERSWFTRGNLVMFTGIRRGNNFVPKLYKSSGYKYPIQLVEKIRSDGSLIFREMRGE